MSVFAPVIPFLKTISPYFPYTVYNIYSRHSDASDQKKIVKEKVSNSYDYEDTSLNFSKKETALDLLILKSNDSAP